MAPLLFLLSPANAAGKRAELLLDGRGRFALARQLQEGGSVSLGDAFSFVSGLYFRGKLAYARRFARAPTAPAGVHVITTNRGLLSPDTMLTGDELRSLAGGEISADDPAYRNPLVRDVAAADQAATSGSMRPEFVLLGSVATGKYVDVLRDVLGERLLFPVEFAGRGDMSRGALLLRSVREGAELEYAPVATVERNVRRAKPVKIGGTVAEVSAGSDAPDRQG